MFNANFHVVFVQHLNFHVKVRKISVLFTILHVILRSVITVNCSQRKHSKSFSFWQYF